MPIITRKITVSTAAILLTTASSLACAANVQPATETAIKAENIRWAEAYKNGDYQAIGRLYTEDGALLQPGGERVVGPAAIVAYFTEAFVGKKPNTVTFSDYEFYGDDRAVTEVSDAVVRDHTGKVQYRGKQILIFLKQNGEWKLHRDMWNDNEAAKPLNP
ncbi:YybH family protein [Pseudomonas asplenii]|uniref:YybH family protein n=1 Tax=Pseudomonas asplenii TaxID=53407 RepID=UPI0006B5564A|nr:DUF4440 domain-containing protein [Pseudomonas fuscovaginae]KPA97045.1 ketosteroid isomerase-like enzyme [Pseudomonas fuscovaginae]